MRFIVAVKQVPDTMDVRTGDDGSIRRADAPAIMDPYSENALMRILSIAGDGDEVIRRRCTCGCLESCAATLSGTTVQSPSSQKSILAGVCGSTQR